jgi:ATP-dependent DNA helicase RecQ
LHYLVKKTDVDCEFVPIALQKKQKTIHRSHQQSLLLQSENLNSRDIQNRTKNNSEVIAVLQYLLENNTILVKPNNKYTLKS